MTQGVAPQRRVPRQSRSRKTVARILDAAVEILVEEGLNGLNTNAIAERAGVNIATLYGYFPDKHSIVSALFENFETARSEAVLAATDAFEHGDDWRGWMRTTIDRMATFRIEWPAGAVLRRALVLHPDLQALDDRSTELATQALTRVLAKHRAQKPQTDFLSVSRVAVITITHLLDHAFASPAPDLDVVEELKALIERYLAPHMD